MRNKVIIDAHATFKYFVLFSTAVTSLSATSILHSAKYKWERNPEIYAREWDGNAEALRKLTDDKFYHLYNDYIAIGRDTQANRNAVKRWFVFMYFIYLIFVLVRLVHILKVLSSDSPLTKYQDILHATLNIILHFFAFFVPFYTAAWLNTVHQDYYRRMCEAYLTITIVVDANNLPDDKQSIEYSCKQGNDIVCTEFYRRRPDEETPLLLLSQSRVIAQMSKELKKCTSDTTWKPGVNA